MTFSCDSALSRSGKNILHVDDNTYYGGAEAAFTLQEADEWAAQLQADEPVLAAAEVVSRDDERLASPRSYSLALAPQIIHARSELLSQLVSSKAFRQIEFLSVGSFYIFEPSAEAAPSLSRVPSTREDVFANTAIPSRSKRFLMKFLKFVLEYDAEPQTDVWTPRADEALADFLGSEFKLDAALQTYVITLTLSPDGRISVRDGLAAIHRHMTSMGRFGTGFAAVYPKWGGLSEVAQVGCRASAVGGAVYMLGTGIRKVADTNTDQGVEVALANDVTVKTKALVQPKTGPPSTAGISLSRLTVVVKSGLSSVFETFIEGAPTPAVAVVGFAAGSVKQDDGTASAYPVYAMVHSSDTGECPVGQSKFDISLYSSSLRFMMTFSIILSTLSEISLTTTINLSDPITTLTLRNCWLS